MSNPIPNRFYLTPQGKRVSMFSGFIPPGSILKQEGWTVQHPDGTTGLARRPFETESEAQAWCDAHPNFKGMSQH